MNYYRLLLVAASFIFSLNSLALSLKCDIELAKHDDEVWETNVVSLKTFILPIDHHGEITDNNIKGFSFYSHYYLEPTFNSIRVRALLTAPSGLAFDKLDIQSRLSLNNEQYVSATASLKFKVDMDDGIDRNKIRITCKIIR